VFQAETQEIMFFVFLSSIILNDNFYSLCCYAEIGLELKLK